MLCSVNAFYTSSYIMQDPRAAILIQFFFFNVCLSLSKSSESTPSFKFLLPDFRAAVSI